MKIIVLSLLLCGIPAVPQIPVTPPQSAILVGQASHVQSVANPSSDLADRFMAYQLTQRSA